VQEAIDVAVILNALRALSPPHAASRRTLGVADEQRLQRGHAELLRGLERLRSIADGLDDATGPAAAALVDEANAIVQGQVVEHERDDEGKVYPGLSKILRDNHGLSAMSRAHREILHVARLLKRAAADLSTQTADRYLIHDAQRLIITIPYRAGGRPLQFRRGGVTGVVGVAILVVSLRHHPAAACIGCRI